MFVFNWFLVRLKVLKNCFKVDKKKFLFKDPLHLIIISVSLISLFLFLNAMFDFIDRKGLPAFDFAFMFLSFTLLVFSLLIFYSAIVTSLSFLFQRQELHFYFSLPIDRMSIFTVKFLQVYFSAVWMVFLGFAVFLIAIQQFFKLSFLIYITGFLSFGIFFLIPVSLAVMTVILISRFFPFVQAKGILVVIGLFVGSVILAAIRLMQPERLFTAEGKIQLLTFVQNLHKPWMTVLPSEWLTNVLFAQAQKDLKGMVINFSSILIVTLALLVLVYLLAKFFYERIWMEASVASPLVSKEFAWQLFLKIFPSSTRSIIKKDLINLYRDTVEKGSLLILIPLCFIYLYSIHIINRHVQNYAGQGMFSFLYIYLFNFFYASTVIAGLSSRWVFPSISMEGNNFKLIKGSGICLQDFLKAKFLLGFIPLLFLAETLILVSSFIIDLKFPFVLTSAIAVFILTWGITLICLILGMRQADFSIKEPLNFALSYKGFLCLVWEFIFALNIIFLIGFPIGIFFKKNFYQFIFSLICSIIIIFTVMKILHFLYKKTLDDLLQRDV